MACRSPPVRLTDRFGREGGETSSIFLSLPPSLLLSFPLSVRCCTVQSDTWISLRVTPSVPVCLTQQQQLFICRRRTSPSLHQFLVSVCLVCYSLERRHFHLADFYNTGCEKYFIMHDSPKTSGSLHLFLFLQNILMSDFHSEHQS